MEVCFHRSVGWWVGETIVTKHRLLVISFFNPSAPFPPKARGRRGFDFLFHPLRSLPAEGPGSEGVRLADSGRGSGERVQRPGPPK